MAWQIRLALCYFLLSLPPNIKVHILYIQSEEQCKWCENLQHAVLSLSQHLFYQKNNTRAVLVWSILNPTSLGLLLCWVKAQKTRDIKYFTGDPELEQMMISSGVHRDDTLALICSKSMCLIDIDCTLLNTMFWGIQAWSFLAHNHCKMVHRFE